MQCRAAQGRASGTGLRENRVRACVWFSWHFCMLFYKGRKKDLYPKTLFAQGHPSSSRLSTDTPLPSYQALGGRAISSIFQQLLVAHIMALGNTTKRLSVSAEPVNKDPEMINWSDCRTISFDRPWRLSLRSHSAPAHRPTPNPVPIFQLTAPWFYCRWQCAQMKHLRPWFPWSYWWPWDRVLAPPM